jgi:hypothetical protein
MHLFQMMLTSKSVLMCSTLNASVMIVMIVMEDQSGKRKLQVGGVENFLDLRLTLLGIGIVETLGVTNKKMKNLVLAISLLVAFQTTWSAQCNLYSFEIKQGDMVAYIFKTFQEMRESREASKGTIFITPEIASWQTTMSISCKNIDEGQMIAYLCKASNTAFYSDDLGNYYIVSSGQIFNRDPRGSCAKCKEAPRGNTTGSDQ